MHLVRPLFYRISMLVNRLTGGERGQSLCARMALKYGSRCAFCKLMGVFLGEFHCLDEMIFDLKRKRGI